MELQPDRSPHARSGTFHADTRQPILDPPDAIPVQATE